MTYYDRPITFCTICGREVASTTTVLALNNTSYASSSKYCTGHKSINPVNRAEKRNKHIEYNRWRYNEVYTKAKR